MDQATAALLGAFIGASAGITGGVVLEMYKPRRDRQGTASAIAGEIASILDMTEKRRYVAYFEDALAALDAGKDVLVPDMVPGGDFRDPVVDRYLDRLGLLPSNLPERIVRFYALLAGVRADIHRAASGEFAGKPAMMAALIREDLIFWQEAARLGQGVIIDLRKSILPRQLWQKGFPQLARRSTD